MTCQGITTPTRVVYITDAQASALRIGFTRPWRQYAFEADTCNRSVALKLQEKGLIVREGRRVTLRLTELGESVVAGMTGGQARPGAARG
jgi:hypothetical protein